MKNFAFLFSFVFFFHFGFCQELNTDFDEFGHVQRNSNLTPMRGLDKILNDASEWTSLGPFGGDVVDIAMDPTNPDRGIAAAGYPYIRTGIDDIWTILESLASLSPAGIHCIEINSNGTMFAAGNFTYGKVFLSNDGGETWTQKNLGINAGILSLTIDPSDPNTIYATTTAIFGSTQSKIVVKSTDEGASWALLDLTSVFPGGYSCVALAVDPGAPQTLFALGSEGISNAWVATSTDGGATWQSAMGNLPTGKPLNAVKIYNGSVYVCGGQLFGGNVMGVYESANYGTSWTNISTSFPNKVANDILVNPIDQNKMYVATEGGGVYYTTDGGLNWNFNTGGAGNNGSARKIIFRPMDTETVIAGFLSLGVCFSEDGGANWVSGTEGIATLELNDIEVDPNNPDIILASFEAENSGGCYILSGENWNLVESLPATRFSAVDIGYDGTMYAWSNGPTTVAAEGLYKSSDGGQTWENMGPNLGSVFETQIWDIEISEADPDLLFISGNNFGVAGWASMLYRSTDQGENWVNVFMGPENDAIRFVHLVQGSDDMDVYAAYNSGGVGGFLKSIDGGTNWLPINAGLPATVKWCGAIVSDPMNSDILYGGVGGYGGVVGSIYKSEDAGSNWSDMGLSLGNYCKITDFMISPQNSMVVYAATTMEGVYMTADGLNWVPDNGGLSAINITGFSRAFDSGFEAYVFLASTATNSAYFTDVFNPTGTGVKEKKNRALLVSPNPALNLITVQLSDQSPIDRITITNLAGQPVFNNQADISSMAKLNIDLNAGIYIITVKSEGQTLKQKLVIH